MSAVPDAAAPARTRGTVLVVGAGLLGASAGLALRARGVDVALDDPSPTARALARDVGAGRLAGPDEDPDLVLVAAPPDVTADVVAAQLLAHPRAVVTDVASVKGAVLQGVATALERAGADPAEARRYVGGHPMAGRERSGATSARPDLFVGRPWVLVPPVAGARADGGPDPLERVRALVDDCRGVPVVMAADEHDEAVAVVSHVPQVAASLVAARLLDARDEAVALAGQGLRDVTRIAASDPRLWVQILGANAAPVARALHALRDDLDDVLGALDALAADGPATAELASAGPVDGAVGARARVARAIDAGGAGVARVPGKHGRAPVPYEVVVVLVPDEPGRLAQLLHDVGDIGVNLEDLVLEHAQGRPVGLAEISVLPAERPRLEAELPRRGWRVAG